MKILLAVVGVIAMILLLIPVERFKELWETLRSD